MELKSLANKVLARSGMNAEASVSFHSLSQSRHNNQTSFGTIISFPLAQDHQDRFEECSAIMEYHAGLPRHNAEILAFHDLKKGIKNDKKRP
jgi:hypothetical protein